MLAGLLMIFVIVPRQIKSSGGFGLDPAFFPVSLLWLLVCLGALLVLTRLPQPADPPGVPGGLGFDNWRFIAGAGLYFAIGFLAIKSLGFVIAGALMIAVMMLIIERGRVRWIEIAALSLAAPFIIYWLLYNVFSVQLPSAPF